MTSSLTIPKAFVLYLDDFHMGAWHMCRFYEVDDTHPAFALCQDIDRILRPLSLLIHWELKRVS